MTDLSQDGIYNQIPDDEYHADRTALSSSGARLLLPPSCPAIFRYRMDHPPVSTSTFDFGHLAHKLVLGVGAAVDVVDAPDWRTKAAKEVRDQAHATGRIPALRSELFRAQAMADEVHCHPVAAQLLDDGVAEVSLTATDPATGIRIKGRPDWMNATGERLVLVDYKTSTTSEPTAFARKAFDYGYHIQAAWYRRMAELCNLGESARFLFIVQEKEPPHLVSVVEFDDLALDQGEKHMRRALHIYKQCLETDIWPGRPDGIEQIALPPWAIQINEEGELIGSSVNDDLIAALEAALAEGETA